MHHGKPNEHDEPGEDATEATTEPQKDTTTPGGSVPSEGDIDDLPGVPDEAQED